MGLQNPLNLTGQHGEVGGLLDLSHRMNGNDVRMAQSAGGSRLPHESVERPVVEGDWEYQPLRLPRDVTRLSATAELGLRAQFGGWELARTLLFADGTRKVWLRRRLSRSALTA